MGTAHAVSHLEPAARRALVQRFPILDVILTLSSAWREVIPDGWKEDPSYWPPYDPGPGDENDNNHDEYKDKATERGRLDLKRRRKAAPTGHIPQTRSVTKRPVQMAINGDNDIEDTRTEKGRYNPHRKRHRGKQRCSAVMTMVERNRQAGTEGWYKEALINWSKQCDPEPTRDVEVLVT